jgi:hypothetical protein
MCISSSDDESKETVPFNLECERNRSPYSRMLSHQALHPESFMTWFYEVRGGFDKSSRALSTQPRKEYSKDS